MTKKALILGAGTSGLGAAKFLRKKQWQVRLSEARQLTPEVRSEFLGLGAEVCDGGHDVSHLDGVAMLVLSPGLPSTHPITLAAKAKGILIQSEIDLALEDYAGTVIAVTGTNGKSTTVAMIGHLLNKLGCGAVLGGNFGDPPTAIIAEGRSREFLVLELSSYQLEQSKPVKPAVAVFTSFSSDHLARHGSMAGYLAAKWRIFSEMKPGSLAIVSPEIQALAAKAGLPPIPEGVNVQSIEPSSKDQATLKSLGLSEAHNQLNAVRSEAVVRHLLGRSKQCLELLSDFRGLPHRCERVGTTNGILIINDSKSTNVESTLSALANLEKGVLLLMGGQGKGESYQPIAQMAEKITLLVTFGATGKEISQGVGKSLNTVNYSTLREALTHLPAVVTPAISVILFSPGCASFDEFRNFEHRGSFFSDTMRQYFTVS